MARTIVAVTRSPLGERAEIKSAHYQQQEIAPLAKIIIRGQGGDETGAVREVLGAEPPQTPNTVVRVGQSGQLLWLGPEEWLLWQASEQREKTLNALQSGFAGIHAAAVDVSDYYTIIRVSGSAVNAVLAHGCPLDLRERAFPVGQCAQSHYRQAAILLYRTGTDSYDAQIRWSFAEYVWDYFATVAKTIAGD